MTPDKRHEFLIRFYGYHTLLTLCSEALHDALNIRTSAREVDLQAIWCGYNAALDVLRLVADQSNAAFLYFVQDSVHVMIAYAAVLLVKVRSATHESMPVADVPVIDPSLDFKGGSS